MFITRPRVALVLLVLGATLMVANSRSAEAYMPRHLELTKAQPAKDSTVAVAPTELKLWFTEPPELNVTSVRLQGPDSAVVVIGKLSIAKTANAPLVVPITGKLKPGKQKVTWKSMSDDGHAVTGEYSFTLAASRPPE